MSSTATSQAERDPVTVLVVDDQPEVAELAQLYLEQADSRLTVAVETDPQAALERFESDAFDCVVSDYNMPGMDGLELCDRIGPRAHCLLFTTADDSGLVEQVRSRGHTYVHKYGAETSYETLYEAILTSIDDRSATSTTRS